MMIDLFPPTLPHRESYTRGKHPQQSDFPLPVGEDTNTFWPFTNSLAASSCSDFTIGYPNRLNATVITASISSLLRFKLDINYWFFDTCTYGKRRTLTFQTSLSANQLIRFRPLKFRGIQIFLYQLDQTLLLPCFSNFLFRSGWEGLGLRLINRKNPRSCYYSNYS